MRRPPAAPRPIRDVARHGVARVISKLGIASRTQAAQWVSEGRVRVNGRHITDAEFPVRQGLDRIEIDGQESAPERLILMLNKPRGLVTTTKDEQGRDTVYRCFDGAGLPWIAPVGRLDKASEGLLLFSNHPEWAAWLTHPSSGADKTYHVQIDRLPDEILLRQLEKGLPVDGEHLSARRVRCLRAGPKHAWIEMTLKEGRNRHIRRLLAAFDVVVLRLVRVAIGGLELGPLPKRGWRRLTEREIRGLVPDLPRAGPKAP